MTISLKDVLKACKGVTSMEEKKIISFFKDFEKKQPVLYSYIIANAEQMKNDDARNDFAYIFSVVWKCYDSMNGKMSIITEEQLTKKENEHIKGWEKFSTIKTDKEEDAFVKKFITQPEIWDFMLDVIYPEESNPDETNFSQDETAIAFACINLMTALLNDKVGTPAAAPKKEVAAKKKVVAKKKVAAKKAAPAKKTAAAPKKKAVAKKATAKPVVKKKAAAKPKATAKKVVKKAAPAKKVVKKAPAKKVVAKKATAKKVVKKPAAKKVVAKAAPKKVVKKVAPKKAVKKTR